MTLRTAVRRGTEHFLVAADSLDELPYEVSSAIRELQPDGIAHKLIVIPPQQYPVQRTGWLRELPFGWRKTPRRTLAFCEHQIILVEKDQTGPVRVIPIPLAALVEMHLTTILLYAFVEFGWGNGDQVRMLTIEFNLVGKTLIRQGMDAARRLIAAGQPILPAEAPVIPTDHLPDLPLKFRNFLRDSLLPGERLAAVLFQTAFRRESGWFHPYISPNRAVAVTDLHIILIEEALRGLHHDYAMIVRFYPLRSVQGITLDRQAEITWATLRLGCGAASHDLSLPLDAANAAALHAALAEKR